MRVSKWGNSLAIRLPASVVEALELKEGDEVQIHVSGTREMQVDKDAARRRIVDRLDTYRGRLPADFKFDRLEANARG
jgi:antitoxin MazE